MKLSIEKNKPTTLVDPICRYVDRQPSIWPIHHPNENELYFCSTQCLEEVLIKKPQ